MVRYTCATRPLDCGTVGHGSHILRPHCFPRSQCGMQPVKKFWSWVTGEVEDVADVYNEMPNPAKQGGGNGTREKRQRPRRAAAKATPVKETSPTPEPPPAATRASLRVQMKEQGKKLPSVYRSPTPPLRRKKRGGSSTPATREHVSVSRNLAIRLTCPLFQPSY